MTDLFTSHSSSIFLSSETVIPALRFDKKRNHLKSLNDYYMMKCRLPEYMDLGKKPVTTLPSFVTFFLVSCLISFEIALLFKFVASW